jgi:SAM-dependent methyltransferase
MAYSEQQDFEQQEAVFFNMRRNLARFDVDVDFENARVLEVGGAIDLLSSLISGVTARTIVAYSFDAQLQYGGQYPRLLKDKFERNGRALDLGKIEFHTVDPINMPYRDGLFDLVLSNNAFHRIRDPFAALEEVLRVLKPGGVAYLSFDPLWTCDSGSQYSHYVPQPWAHLLCSADEFAFQMREAGAADAAVSDFMQGPNRIVYRDYQTHLYRVLAASGLKAFHVEHWSGLAFDNALTVDNQARAAAALNCNPDDLLVRGFLVLAVK